MKEPVTPSVRLPQAAHNGCRLREVHCCFTLLSVRHSIFADAVARHADTLTHLSWLHGVQADVWARLPALPRLQQLRVSFFHDTKACCAPARAGHLA